MKLDDVDRLMADLHEEAVSGQSDEYARSLMADASALFRRYRYQLRVSEAIAAVLDQTQEICEHPCPAADMINVLRELGHDMQTAARKCVAAHAAGAKMPDARLSPEDLARRTADAWRKQTGPDMRGLNHFLTQAIREDRLFERNQS